MVAAVAALALALLERELGRLGRHAGEGGHAAGDEDVAADHGAPADASLAAEDRRPGVDGHVVLDGRVALLAAQGLAELRGDGAEGDALVDLNVVADLGGLADHDAGAVV